MSVRDPLNRHQKAFLRKMRNDPDGLPQEQWPQAVALRRWLRKPRFKRALKSLRETFAAEIDVMLAGAAARAAKRLQAMLAGESGGQDQEQRIQALVRVIRVAHLRAKESPRRARRSLCGRDLVAQRPAWEAADPRAAVATAEPFSGLACGAGRAADPRPVLAIDGEGFAERRSA